MHLAKAAVRLSAARRMLSAPAIPFDWAAKRHPVAAHLQPAPRPDRATKLLPTASVCGYPRHEFGGSRFYLGNFSWYPGRCSTAAPAPSCQRKS